MAAFTAQDVKTLREKTGCGMMDCKKALTNADGDMDKAVDFLREQGLAKQAKKAGRIAAEGVAYACTNDDLSVGVVVEVNAETDFVAKNDSFMDFVKACANTIIEQNPADVEALLTLKATGSEQTIAEMLQEKVLTIGENIQIRRFERMEMVLVLLMYTQAVRLAFSLTLIQTSLQSLSLLHTARMLQCRLQLLTLLTSMRVKFLQKSSSMRKKLCVSR